MTTEDLVLCLVSIILSHFVLIQIRNSILEDCDRQLDIRKKYKIKLSRDYTLLKMKSKQ